MILTIDDGEVLLSNQEVFIINMNTPTIEHYENSGSFISIPADRFTPGSIMIVRDPGRTSDYVVKEINEKEITIERVSNESKLKLVALAKTLALLAAEANISDGTINDYTTSIGFLRGLV